MAQVFLLPQLGSTMEEGTILKWHKREGDAVQKGEILLEIETDKASMEVPAEIDGVVRKLLVPENELVPIRTPIAVLGDPNEPIDHLLPNAPQAPTTSQTKTAISTSLPVLASHVPDAMEELRISPRARRLADEQGLTLSAALIQGTGPEGRVVERDIVAYLATQQNVLEEKPVLRTTPLAARVAQDLGVNLQDLALGLPGSRVRRDDVVRHANAQTVPEGTAPSITPEVGYTGVPFGGLRKKIGDNVAKAAFSMPHVTLTLEVDMTECVNLRTLIIPQIERQYGTRVSFTDFLVKAAEKALANHSLVNSGLVGDEIRRYHSRNIGVAVALEEGLIVPVVKHTENKTLGMISAELKPLIDRARTGKATLDDLSEGTFTITNLGGFGIDLFDPIIVPGQAAILGVGRIAEKPVVRDKAIVIRSMMNLCLSFDHRILDGAPAARFLQNLQELLENPISILL